LLACEKCISGIPNTITIIIRVSVVTDTITIRIDGFGSVKREDLVCILDQVTVLVTGQSSPTRDEPVAG
jgi:hypothetical protein